MCHFEPTSNMLRISNIPTFHLAMKLRAIRNRHGQVPIAMVPLTPIAGPCNSA